MKRSIFPPQVVGIDVSESQILSAKNSTNIPSNVEFKVGPSEVLNYEDETVDLITVCQAVHWFDIPKFYKEVDRVLKPNGVLAVIGYHTPNICENIGMTLEQANHLNDLRNNFFFETLKSYWAPEVYMVTSSYDQLPIISYETIERCNHFFVDVEGTIEDMAGDILTWSGFNKFRQIKGDDEAMEKFEKFLEDTENFCNKNQKLTLRHRYFMILGCKSGK